jgi:hypothetical protein
MEKQAFVDSIAHVLKSCLSKAEDVKSKCESAPPTSEGLHAVFGALQQELQSVSTRVSEVVHTYIGRSSAENGTSSLPPSPPFDAVCGSLSTAEEQLTHLKQAHARVASCVDSGLCVMPQAQYLASLHDAIKNKEHEIGQLTAAKELARRAQKQHDFARAVQHDEYLTSFMQEMVFVMKESRVACESATSAFQFRKAQERSKHHHLKYLMDSMICDLRFSALQDAYAAKEELMRAVSKAISGAHKAYMAYKGAKTTIQNAVHQRIPTLLAYTTHVTKFTIADTSSRAATLHQLSKDFLLALERAVKQHEKIAACVLAVCLSYAVVACFGVDPTPGACATTVQAELPLP